MEQITEISDFKYSHFEDAEGKKYHLNDPKIEFMFSDGVLIFFTEKENYFDTKVELIKETKTN